MQNRVFHRVLEKCVLLLFVAGLGCAAQATPEEPPGALAMTGDILIARPIGVVVTAVGTLAFLASLPFTALGGNVGEAGKTLVASPAKETFVRCLGCTSSGRKSKGAESK